MPRFAIAIEPSPVSEPLYLSGYHQQRRDPDPESPYIESFLPTGYNLIAGADTWPRPEAAHRIARSLRLPAGLTARVVTVDCA